MMGFIKQQEQKLAIRLLAWHYERNAMIMPPPSELRQQAERLVTDAHRIARERGQNVLAIIKELVGNIKKG
jgi:BMFP domain-containing protein YqiC